MTLFQKIVVAGSIAVGCLFMLATAAVLLTPSRKHEKTIQVTFQCGRTFCDQTSVFYGEADDPAFASFVENTQRSWLCPVHQ